MLALSARSQRPEAPSRLHDIARQVCHGDFCRGFLDYESRSIHSACQCYNTPPCDFELCDSTV